MSAPDLDRLVARLRAAGCVFAESEAALLVDAATGEDELEALVARRVAGQPLEHLLGWVELCGIRFAVGPGVFVPRQRTALLVEEARRLVRAGSVVVDLCCGCGALGGALAHLAEGITLVAADLDPVALTYARENLHGIGEVYLGDLYDALPRQVRGSVDVILANTPYVPTAEIANLPPEAREHEPRGTLDGGPDGLDVQRRVAAEAPAWLAPGGHLLVEVAEKQVPTAEGVFARNGLAPRVVRDDEHGAIAVVGRWDW